MEYLLTNCPQRQIAGAKLVPSNLKGSSVTEEDTEKCHVRTKAA